jgi:hypothetical protein
LCRDLEEEVELREHEREVWKAKDSEIATLRTLAERLAGSLNSLYLHMKAWRNGEMPFSDVIIEGASYTLKAATAAGIGDKS